MQDLWTLLPEIFLLSMSCFILILDLFLSPRFKIISYGLVQVTLLTSAGLCWWVLNHHLQTVFANQFIADNFSQILKMIILVIVSFVLLYSRRYIMHRKIAAGEYQILVLFSTLGMMCLASANSTLMIYLGLELLSLPLYALVALNRESAISVEAGMKYFIMGSLASGMLLYGLSLLFGLTGTLILPDIAIQLWTAQGMQLGLFIFSLVFIVAGIAFKFGAVPFHMWIPDVYQGAASSVTMLIGSAPKLAAFAMTYRLLAGTLPELADIFGQFFILLALFSLAVGNIVAIAQTNIKRMFGYSAIAHVGFISLGIVAGPAEGYVAVTFYVVVYSILALGAFATIVILSHKDYEMENINDFKGLAQRNPWIAFLMMLFLFSFAGVPPTIGFYAKFIIINALVNVDLTWLASVSVLFSVIGAFYYLRVIKVMYFEKPDITLPIISPLDARVALSVNGLFALGLGIFPAPLFILCQKMVLGG